MCADFIRGFKKVNMAVGKSQEGQNSHLPIKSVPSYREEVLVVRTTGFLKEIKNFWNKKSKLIDFI